MAKQGKLVPGLARQLLSGLAVVLVVGGVVWFTAHPHAIRIPGLTGPGRSAGGGVSSSVSKGSALSSPKVASNGTDPYEQRLRDILDGVAGLQEVALANDKSGETITATINVPVQSHLSTIEDSLITQYMSDVFDTDPLIQTANVYFISDGTFLAGGGLSRAAYGEWAVSTSAGHQDNVEAWMAGLSAPGHPSTTNAKNASSAVTGWFETASPASAGS